MADPVSLAITVALNAAVMGMTMMQKIEGPRLDDLSVSTADYGTPLPNVHGAMRVECICFYAEPLREVKETSKTKGGKYDQYKYFGTWASLVADHEIDMVLRVWIDRRLAYDRTTAGPMSLLNALAAIFDSSSDKLTLNGNFRIYLGTETQIPDPRLLAKIEEKEGAGRCPAYLGVSYMVFEEIPLEKFGNRLPQVSAEPLRGNGTNPFPYYSTSGLSSLLNSGLTPNRKYLVATDSFGSGNQIQLWDLVNRKLVSEAETPVAVTGNDFAVTSNTSIIATTGGLTSPAIWELGVFGGGADLDVDFEAAAIGGCTLAAGQVFVLPGISTWHEYSDVAGIKYSTSFAPTCFFGDVDGDAWVIGPEGSGGIIVIARAPGGGGFAINSGFDTDCAAMDNGAGQFFVFQHNHKALLIDKSTLAIVNTSADLCGNVGGSALRRQFSVVTPGAASCWVNFQEWDTRTGELIRTVDPFDWKAAGTTRSIYDPLNNAIISQEPFTSTNITWRFLDRASPDGVTLGSICEIVGLLAGFQLGDYDFTDLDQIVPGYLWTQGSAKDVIGALLEIYDSDIRPHGFIQEGLKRGKSQSGPPILSEWMVAQGGGNDSPLYRLPIASETDLPRRVFCTFADPSMDDQPNTAIAQRNQASVVTTREVSFDLTTMRSSADDIQPKVERALRRYWVGSTKPECTLSPLELKTEPGDVRILSFDNELLRCRALRTIIRADRAIETQWEVDGETPITAIDWESDDFASLTVLFNSPGGVTNGRPPDVILIPMDSEGFVLDTGLLTDADDLSTPFVYIAAGPIGEGFWPGTNVAASDFGTDDSYVFGWDAFTSDQPATWGLVTSDPLPEAATDVIDNGTVLTVVLPLDSTLSSITEDQMLAGPTLNLAVVGQEIIQFRDAELTSSSPRTYELSGLVRGARGTEWAVADHAAGERFLLINANVRRHVMGASEIGDTDYYKFSTSGDDLAGAPTITVAFAGNANRPLSPAHLSLVRNTGTGDWAISWIRRTRVGGGTVNGQDVPLGETSELYRAKIMDGADVLRTIEVTAQSAAYTAAQQTADWGGAQTALSVEVVQVSPSLSLEGFTASASA